jgi:modulator of FtsH protease HflK
LIRQQYRDLIGQIQPPGRPRRQTGALPASSRARMQPPRPKNFKLAQPRGFHATLAVPRMANVVSVSPNPIHPVRFGLGVIACIGIFLTLLTLLFGFKSIPANSVGVKTRFGAYHTIVDPGLAYAIPYVDQIHIVATQRLLKLEFGLEAEFNATNPFQRDLAPADTETMITGDLNTALVPWVVQYRITDPKIYLFGANEPEQTLRDLSESVMREVIGDRTVDEVLTIGRHEIETATLTRLADLCSHYNLGFQIQQVQLATVRPPPVVQAAFNEVNQAQQEKQTAINQAWAVYNDAVPNARGQAKEREKQAEAYAFRRVNEAKGEAQKFSLLLAEYRKAPDITRRRLYLEAMQAILPSLQKKVIVDDSLRGILQTLPLLPPDQPKSSSP